MPWPIPKLLKLEHPKPISWRAWLPTLLVIASSALGAVLLLWPHSKPTNTAIFWALLVGAPLVACGLVSAVALDRWESATVQVEEGAHEQVRLGNLWRSWCQRHLRVAAAVAITSVPTESFDGAGGDLPVNKDRAKGLVWKTGKGAGERYGKVVSELAARLKPALQNRRELAVTLLHVARPKQIADFEKEFRNALEKVAPETRFSLKCEPMTDCAPWVAQQVDQHNDAARLMVAVQIWPDDDAHHAFSEGAAAILLEPSKTAEVYTSRILRPMQSAADTLEADVAQMVEMQITPQKPTHFWHTGCDAQLSSAIQSAIEADPKHPVVERSFDHVIGLPGPATSWLMLATALEVAQPESGAHMLAACSAVDQQVHLCMIVPAAQKVGSEGKRSES